MMKKKSKESCGFIKKKWIVEAVPRVFAFNDYINC